MKADLIFMKKKPFFCEKILRIDGVEKLVLFF